MKQVRKGGREELGFRESPASKMLIEKMYIYFICLSNSAALPVSLLAVGAGAGEAAEMQKLPMVCTENP